MFDIGLKFYTVPSPPPHLLTDLYIKVTDLEFFMINEMSISHISQSSESIHLSNIRTLEGLLPFHNYWPQSTCHGVGLEVKNIEHPHTLAILSSFFWLQVHFGFFGKAQFRRATLFWDNSYSECCKCLLSELVFIFSIYPKILFGRPLITGGVAYNFVFSNCIINKGVIIIHHHHIHFRALFSSTEGWAFWQVFLEGVLSTQNDFEGQQNPYLASFCHSQALHPMISLACQIFSVQPHSACVLLQSSLCCALHVQTISSYWCGAPHLSPGCQALWEGSLS